MFHYSVAQVGCLYQINSNCYSRLLIRSGQEEPRQNSLVLQQIQNEFKNLYIKTFNKNHVITRYHCSKRGTDFTHPFYSKINMSKLHFIISRKAGLSSGSGNHSSCKQNSKVSFIQCRVHFITKYE